MRLWRFGGGEEGGTVQGRDASHVDCGSGYKHQRSVFDISVMHVHEGDAPGVVTRSGRAWERSSNCKPSSTLNDMVLTSGYAEDLGNALMGV